MVDVKLRRKEIKVWYWKCPICKKEILHPNKKVALYRAKLHALSHSGLKFNEYMDEFAKVVREIRSIGG